MRDNTSGLTSDQLKKLRGKFALPAVYMASTVILFGLGLVGAITEPFRYQELIIAFCLIASAIFSMQAVFYFGVAIAIFTAEIIFMQRSSSENS